MSLKIVTNNQPREVIYGHELPNNKRKDFDYIDKEEFDLHSFVKYRGNYYDVSEFMRIENNSELNGWDGYQSDSYFSGVLIKFCKDDDGFVIMGTYLS